MLDTWDVENILWDVERVVGVHTQPARIDTREKNHVRTHRPLVRQPRASTCSSSIHRARPLAASRSGVVWRDRDRQKPPYDPGFQPIFPAWVAYLGGRHAVHACSGPTSPRSARSSARR